MFRPSFKWLLLAAVVSSLFLVSCQASGAALPTATSTFVPTPAPVSEVDGLGRSVILAEPARRIVSLAPSNTEILFAVGAGSQVVGRDEFTNYPEEATSLPAVGGSFGNYNPEAIVELQPDLVLAAEINTPEQVQALEQLGLTVFLLANPVDMEGVYQNLLLVGRLTGQEAQASALVDSLKTRVASITEKIAAATDRPTVFYELDSTDPSAPFTSGPGTFIDLLIDMAGGKNIGAVLGAPWAQISLEELVVQNPEIILLGDAAYGVTPENVAARAGWERLDAVKNGRVFPFNDDLASRPGPRLVDGLEEMAKLFHPDLFK